MEETTKEMLIRKLTSRKFILAVIGLVSGLMIYFGKTEADADQVGALIMSAASVVAYILAEGITDAAGARSDIYVTEEDASEEENT